MCQGIHVCIYIWHEVYFCACMYVFHIAFEAIHTCTHTHTYIQAYKQRITRSKSRKRGFKHMKLCMFIRYRYNTHTHTLVYFVYVCIYIAVYVCTYIVVYVCTYNLVHVCTYIVVYFTHSGSHTRIQTGKHACKIWKKNSSMSSLRLCDWQLTKRHPYMEQSLYRTRVCPCWWGLTTVCVCLCVCMCVCI
jgi:hypothetical protein